MPSSYVPAQSSPAVARNRDPILAVLRRVLPARGTVLEVASGTGEHAVYFAAALPHLTWQPSDPDADARASIAAYREAAQLPNLKPVLAFKENGVHTAPSNAAFDASLRARDPQWGVRDVGAVAALAERNGLALVERVAMPANNLSLVFQRQGSS
jgi:hypothetical protein